MNAPAEAIAAARTAQAAWERTPVAERLRPIRALRRSLAEDPTGWADAVTPPQERTRAESLAAEVLPLADACRWLEKHAARTLAPRREGGWFDTVALRVERKPLGLVLVIGASNYPLFLLAAPAIQALAAGDAAVLKPPPGGEPAAEKLHETLVAGGLDARLAPRLDSTAEAATGAIDAGVDHVVLTGAAETGAAVAKQAADTLTPCTLECSGADAVVVLPGADLERVARCVAWGLTFNSGATCIAPRRVIAGASQLNTLSEKLKDLLAGAEPRGVPQRSSDDARRLVAEALDAGTEVVAPPGFDRQALEAACDAGRLPPIVLRAGGARPALLDADLFAPVATLVAAESVDERLAAANDCPYALGASVFGPADEAGRVAPRLRAGCVTVNDLIAPTADARAPFGGVGRSGYGVTRGREGLLAMTRPQAVVRRRGSWLPHLDEPTDALDDLVAGMIQSQHAAGLAAKWHGLRLMVNAARRHRGKTTEARRE